MGRLADKRAKSLGQTSGQTDRHTKNNTASASVGCNYCSRRWLCYSIIMITVELSTAKVKRYQDGISGTSSHRNSAPIIASG